MGVTVYIPTPFRRLTSNQAKVQVEAHDVAALLDNLEASFPGIRHRVIDSQGRVHRFVNVFVNNEDIGALEGRDSASGGR